MRLPHFFLIQLFFLAVSTSLSAQTMVNGYARVTAISGTTLTVSNVNESGDTFENGERAIIMQMQDDVIGSTSNDASFGDIDDIASAGLYEIVTLQTVNESSGTPASIVVSSSLTNSYNTGPNSSLQIITYPVLDDGGGDYTTTDDIVALDWNGNIGGVIAFSVNGTLTLLHNINANGAGFDGATTNGGGSTGCSVTPYRTFAGNDHANKGEGIYNSSDASFAAARGKILNGGGGGNSHNGGGGGGGNYSAGGDGGPGWASGGNCEDNSVGSAGGIGGIALSTYITTSRIFMGGGGGSGEGNDGLATGGADGGGIILISANSLETTAGCSGVSISANGDNANATGGNDAGGGAGAGGSVVLQIPNYNVNATCNLIVEANGGNGGDVNHGLTHGGGGGGGMGVVIYSIPAPTTNIITNTDPGNGGANDNSGSGGSAAGGGGTPGAGGGIVDNSNTPLPVELIDFRGRSEGDQVILNWSTASELNNDYFDVQMSRDGRNFVTVGKVNGSGTTDITQNYQFSHFNPFSGLLYYRLKQVDYDGGYEYSRAISVDHRRSFETFQVFVYPNPVEGEDIRLKILTDSNKDVDICIRNAHGLQIRSVKIAADELRSEVRINVRDFSPGVYFLDIKQGNYSEVKKVVVD